MNAYTEIIKLKAKLIGPDEAHPIIACTLDENEDLEGKLPIVVIEAGATQGQYVSTGKFSVEQHNVTMHCICSAHEIAFDTACANTETLATNVMAQFAGLKIRVKENGIDRSGLLIGSEKVRCVILDCITYE
jgi:hypothetical protein